jgi:anti-anti-sigma factor
MGPDDSPADELSRQSSPALPDSRARRGFGLALKEQDATLLLRIRGEFDWSCVGRVEGALEHISAVTKRVVFDLRGLTFIDLRGLKTILRADQRARSGAFEVVVVRPWGLASRVFTLTRAGERLTIVDRPPPLAGSS